MLYDDKYLTILENCKELIFNNRSKYESGLNIINVILKLERKNEENDISTVSENIVEYMSNDLNIIQNTDKKKRKYTNLQNLYQ